MAGEHPTRDQQHAGEGRRGDHSGRESNLLFDSLATLSIGHDSFAQWNRPSIWPTLFPDCSLICLGGIGTIFDNSEKVAEGKIEKTEANVFSVDEGADVGRDGETPVTSDYKEGDNTFTSKIGKVTAELK